MGMKEEKEGKGREGNERALGEPQQKNRLLCHHDLCANGNKVSNLLA